MAATAEPEGLFEHRADRRAPGISRIRTSASTPIKKYRGDGADSPVTIRST